MRRKTAYIHEQPDWPTFRWDAGVLSARLGAVRLAQGRLVGGLEALGFEVRAEAGLAALTSEVVKSSAIEGEVLNPAEVRSSIARRLGLDADTAGPSRREIEGIVEVMVDATRNFEAPLTAERLFGWHAAIFPTARSGMQRITVGAWRRDEEGPMRVISGAKGRIHFEAPAARRVPGEMEHFLAWFAAPSPVDPVLRAAIAHLWFVTIHPFDDGNGRIARAIADMALARSDGRPERFYSMSTQIEVERAEYYRVLEEAQSGDMHITPWLEWFLSCLGRAIDRAEGTLHAVKKKSRRWAEINRRPVNERQRMVMNALLDGVEGFLTTSKYAKLAKCSTDTALRDIRELVEHGALVPNAAGGRSTSYRLADEPA